MRFPLWMIVKMKSAEIMAFKARLKHIASADEGS